MKKALLIPFLLFLTLNLGAKSYFSVRPTTQVSLLTASSSDALYSAFGHSAIRVKDSAASFDIVFNYGAFDFEQPAFYWLFIRGKLSYSLVIVPIENFIQGYKDEGRSLSENVLNLDSADKQKIFDFLMRNAEPENREYQYDFFYDNCATRIRDVFEAQLGSDLILGYGSLATLSALRPSMRDLLVPHLTRRSYARLAFSVILGLPSDAEASPRMKTFLPDSLKKAFANATIRGHAFSQPSQMIYVSPAATPQAEYLLDPTLILPVVILLIGLACFVLRLYGLFASVILAATGLAGLLLCFMWLFTDHTSTHCNLNLLWALPWNVLFAAGILLKRFRPLCLKYSRLYGLWLILFFILSFFIPQSLHITIRICMLSSGVLLSLNKNIGRILKQDVPRALSV